MRLVILIALVPKRGLLPVKANRQGVGFLLMDQLPHHRHEPIDGVCGLAPGRCEGPDGVKRPVAKGVAVDEIKPRRVRFGLIQNFSCFGSALERVLLRRLPHA